MEIKGIDYQGSVFDLILDDDFLFLREYQIQYIRFFLLCRCNSRYLSVCLSVCNAPLADNLTLLLRGCFVPLSLMGRGIESDHLF